MTTNPAQKLIYRIDYFKSRDLTPDERNAMRRDARGIWISTGIFTMDRKAGLREARRDFRGEKFRAV